MCFLYIVPSSVVFMLKPVATDKRICPKPCLVYTFHTHNDDYDDVDGGGSGSDRHHDYHPNCKHKSLVQEYCLAMAQLLNEGRRCSTQTFLGIEIQASILVTLKVFPQGRGKVKVIQRRHF